MTRTSYLLFLHANIPLFISMSPFISTWKRE